MENLINQMRHKVSGGGQGQAAGSSIPRERRIPIHKTQSFKGEKGSQSWLGRQFLRQMSRSRSSSRQSPVDELAATAVAAATFAVKSLEDSKEMIGQKSTSLSPQDSSLTKAKSRKDKATRPPEPGTSSSSRPSGEVSKTKSQGSPETRARSPNLQRRPTFDGQISDKSDSRSPKIPTPPPPPPPHPTRPSQSIKKPTSPPFPASSSTMRPETSSSKPNSKPASTPSSQPLPKPTSESALSGGTRADAWEAKEMEKITKRYEKLNATIASWEEGKKKKARATLDNTESELARRRSKAMQKFKEEMESINQIAGGARAQAEQRRRNEELKAKAKAIKYRRTGKFPRTCFCF